MQEDRPDPNALKPKMYIMMGHAIIDDKSRSFRQTYKQISFDAFEKLMFSEDKKLRGDLWQLMDT